MKNLDDIHGFSMAVPKLLLSFNGEIIAVASGLVAGFGGQKYLITACHNLSGREPDGKPKGKFPPNEVRLHGYHIEATLPLYAGDNDPSQEETRFFKLNRTRDIAILPITLDSTRGEKVYHPLHESFLADKKPILKIGISDTCFVIGYPSGIQTDTPEGPLPIWKAATIASEPRFTGPEQPLLIDTWGEPGLSGGPVFSEREVGSTEHRRLIGIYTGRRFTNPHQNQKEQSLGTVTPTELVVELLNSIR